MFDLQYVGVNFVGLGAQKDSVEVIGDGVDATKLVNTMRKKVGHTDLVSVQAVKWKQDESERERERAFF
jgi:hypothetical protein